MMAKIHGMAVFFLGWCYSRVKEFHMSLSTHTLTTTFAATHLGWLGSRAVVG